VLGAVSSHVREFYEPESKDLIMALSRKQLVHALTALTEANDAEVAHSAADQLLIEYIDDEEIADLFKSIVKWYS
jgi:hypothetical protein